MLRVQSPLSPDEEAVVAECIGCGLTVHRVLGPGYKEQIYERAYCLELDSRNIKFVTELAVNVRYRDWLIPGQRIDLIVGGIVLVEIKALPRVKPLHRRQVVSYLKTTGLRVGLIMSFNTVLFKHGLRRVVL